MGHLKYFLILLFLFPSVKNAQSGNFNVSEYKSFLQQNQNMTTDQILNMYPAGLFKSQINSGWEDALFADSIEIKYTLTPHEKSLLNENGFMVTERLRQPSFGLHLLDIYHKDLPVFISTDAILHAFHFSYDRILRDAELGILIDRITDFLNNMHAEMGDLEAYYANNPSMSQTLRDIDVYITVPRKLLNPAASPYYSENNPYIDTLLNYIDSEQFREVPFFSIVARKIDFSQFKPRGHYDTPNYPQLARYFKAMMWLGRMELYLLPPNSFPAPLPGDVQRQTIMSYLYTELVDNAGLSASFREIEKIIGLFVGDQDNVTLENLYYLKEIVEFSDAAALLNFAKLNELQDSLRNQGFAFQLIMSQMLRQNPFSPDSLTPASAFLPFGQRFVIDSYITGSVVFDRIKYLGLYIKRMLPSTLDILFAMGNDAALQLLVPELNQYHYAANLAALRYLVDSYDQGVSPYIDTNIPGFWNRSIYNFWLNSIRKLNPPAERSNMPPFMETSAWWLQKMNTQLSSWIELRHDNLLYAKQSYTAMPVCSYPYSYVEPFPEFYGDLSKLARFALEKFEYLPFNDPARKDSVINYFIHLRDVSDTLKTIAQKEIAGIEFSQEEKSFLHNMLYNQTATYNEPPYDGWYPKLYYSFTDMSGMIDSAGFLEKDYLVADYHTSPADEWGNTVGWVAHAGTGPVDLMAASAVMPDGQHVAFVGPVMSYYEYTSSNFLRLTDDEWEYYYLELAERPEWSNSYIADENGNSPGNGPTLFLHQATKEPGASAQEYKLIAKNYPNPFNSTTIISFSVPFDLTNSKTELKLFDIQGRLVKLLLNDLLPSGNYLVRWDGKNGEGVNVASGIYFYELKVGAQKYMGKMNLIK